MVLTHRTTIGFSVLPTLLLITTLAGDISAHLQQQRGNPNDMGTVVVDEYPLPRTLEEFVRRTPVVVRGRVLAARTLRLSEGRRTPIVYRPYELQILEVIKGSSIDLAEGSTVEVLEVGGSFEKDGKLYRTANTLKRSLKPDDELVLFLYREGRSYEIAAGNNGVLVLPQEADGVVTLPPGFQQMSFFAERSGVSRDELLQRLRSIKF